MKFSIFILILLSEAAVSLGQADRIDSLQRISTLAVGEARVDILNELSRSLAALSYKRSTESAIQAFRLADNLKYEKGKALSLINQAINENSVGKNKETRLLLNKSIEISYKMKDQSLEGYAFACLGFNYMSTDKLDTAIILYNRSMDLLQDNKQPQYLSFLYLMLADYYGIKGETQNQLDYLNKAWIIREKLKNKTYLTHAGTRLAAFYANAREFKKALFYLDASQNALGKDTIDNEEIALIHQHRASVFAKRGDNSRALVFFYKARKFYEFNSFPLELTRLLIETGSIFDEMANYEASQKNYFDALKIAEANNFEFERVKISIGISWIYFHLEQIKLAERYIEKVLPLASKLNHKFEEGSALNLMGLIRDKQNKNKEAWGYYNKALQLRQILNDRRGMAGTLNNMAALSIKEENFTKGLEYLMQSTSLEETLNHEIGMAYSYESLGKLFTQLHQYKKSKHYLARAEILSRKIQARAILVDVFLDRGNLAKFQGKPIEAYNYLLLYVALKDSIFSKNLANRISSLQSLYELEKKDNQIQIINKNKELQDQELIIQKAKVNQQWLAITVVSVMVILLGIIAIGSSRNNKRTQALNKAIREQNEEIQGQDKELTKSNNLLRTLNVELENQKDEIAAKNEGLVENNKELSAQRSLIAQQMMELEQAQVTIKNQYIEIRKRNVNLETEVENRTRELIEYNQQLEQFAFIASHNLRAPVATILGLGQLLELPGKNESDESQIKKNMIMTAKEMDRVVRDLTKILDFKHNIVSATEIRLQEELDLVKINLQKEIEETHSIITADFSKVPVIRTVRIYFESILYNLISNGIKFRHLNEPALITLRAEIQDDFVCLIVSDNGLGIDLHKYKDKLFTLYSRFHSHVEGKGLGLFLVKTQLTSLGGKIRVESELDKGTTFYLYLKNLSLSTNQIS